MFCSVKETGCTTKISPNITTASSSLCMSRKEDMFTGAVTRGIEIGDRSQQLEYFLYLSLSEET